MGPSFNYFYRSTIQAQAHLLPLHWMGYLCCVFRPANACLRMYLHGRKWWKTLENEKFEFLIKVCLRRISTINCRPAFVSHSQLLTNKLFSSFFFLRLTWTSWMFFIVFDLANTCTSMRSLVKIHNTPLLALSKAFISLFN